ncbi:hypothetical protein OUZ56_013139 [Daphnia magna]|uniref:Uncharacterized protein n=1 Tax=Daphnia magna TaxID=35525 RepID=A0ABQ9Z500_9CRUS|nr:hypothetical protein OUZ56_013139 [Daphnia magna]
MEGGKRQGPTLEKCAATCPMASWERTPQPVRKSGRRFFSSVATEIAVAANRSGISPHNPLNNDK